MIHFTRKERLKAFYDEIRAFFLRIFLIIHTFVLEFSLSSDNLLSVGIAGFHSQILFLDAIIMLYFAVMISIENNKLDFSMNEMFVNIVTIIKKFKDFIKESKRKIHYLIFCHSNEKVLLDSLSIKCNHSFLLKIQTLSSY
jgi:hypothetical protein